MGGLFSSLQEKLFAATQLETWNNLRIAAAPAKGNPSWWTRSRNLVFVRAGLIVVSFVPQLSVLGITGALGYALLTVNHVCKGIIPRKTCHRGDVHVLLVLVSFEARALHFISRIVHQKINISCNVHAWKPRKSIWRNMAVTRLTFWKVPPSWHFQQQLLSV